MCVCVYVCVYLSRSRKLIEDKYHAESDKVIQYII